MAEEIDRSILRALTQHGEIQDTGAWAKAANLPHDDTLVGALNRLEHNQEIEKEKITRSGLALTDEAEEILTKGSSEIRTLTAIPKEGVKKDALEKTLGANLFKIGFMQCIKSQWIKYDKSSDMITKLVDDVKDETRQNLADIKAGKDVSDSILKGLRSRKLVVPSTTTTYHVRKGANFGKEVIKPLTDLTQELLTSGSWRDREFKANLNCLGLPTSGGYLHPLLKVRSEFREIFLDMGFEEMPTNNYVESSFWNFDSLFQPQQHPARDAHDTFFLSDPELSDCIPEDYLDRVKNMHVSGGNGSIGWRYDWKELEAKKNILRTHTTAVSSRMLYKLAQNGFTPKKYFSIDRVFRNEALDATHLAEFHQIEGLVADYNLTLGNLMGIISQFFQKLGITKLRFKPAYNPYTEPSMEVFSWHEGLNKWVEVGNSGVFRPEMLQPMGLPENVRVIAWGLSLERPTMIRNRLNNIRDLVGHKVSIDFVKTNPICRLDQ